MKTFPLLAFSSIVLLASGCKPADEEITEAPVGTSVPFEGAPDARFAGTWTAADNRLTYTLKEDGSYTTDLTSALKGQKDAVTHSVGEWRVKDDRMLFKDAASNVVPYTYELKGDTLTFTSVGSLKGKTILKKK